MRERILLRITSRLEKLRVTSRFHRLGFTNLESTAGRV